MACPTCDHTMHSLETGWFWCPRCGTVINIIINSEALPYLIERCREFEKGVGDYDPQEAKADWHELGIAESINKPEDRPTL